ncbi:hypothetical protein MKW94_012374 [Papaver nudicaule]|uniref:Secreted protein n=1 Tax=Papaver nudicaule TaxID=74823 RepID=A0AA41SBM5_PAPNU|nr:hypothetical protein [Papaver nudicaule]
MFLFILVARVAVLSSAQATRVLLENFASANHSIILPSAYQKANSTMTCFLGHLR